MASGFLSLAVYALHAQTARPQKAPATVPSTSTVADPAKIKQDEARLLALLAKNPDDPGALAGMAWVRSRQKNYTAAISYLEHAKQKRPNDAGLNVALNEARFHVLLTEAQSSAASNDPQSAQKFFSQALQIHPHSREALDGMHRALLPERLR